MIGAKSPKSRYHKLPTQDGSLAPVKVSYGSETAIPSGGKRAVNLRQSFS